MSKESIIKMFFGNNNKTRFKRLLTLLCVIGLFLMLFYCLKYSKKTGVEWMPAGKVNVEVKR